MPFSGAIQAIKHHRPTNSSSLSIPKLIHQTYFARENIPPELQENIEKLKRDNPNWKYYLYNDRDIENFIQTIYGDAVLKSWHRIDPAYGAARADLFRYLCLYHFGGVYMDIKSSLSKPLDELIQPDDHYLLSQWDHSKGSQYSGWGLHQELKHIPGGEYIQWFIACRPGHPFIREVLLLVLQRISRYNPIFDKTGQIGVVRLTGPIPYSQAIHPIRDQHPHRLLATSREQGFIYSIYDQPGQLYKHRKLFGKHYSQLVHPIVSISSWRLFLFRVYCRYKKRPYQ
ncbi:glycosyltransferase family 32 protein [Chromobacterium violaceum]|uniref:glycosyltransferase family 32 protein n=1 Tax=Chromobacterium violaceum TaxID=536 RepID=UPI0009D92279|nr:glycosyltransferase [Chromobacterium violaceum]MBX9266408.1 hypothetical protein [Chromobacterium violaceum]OQS11198.1 hypothetical protein B0T38_04375 [Chromobacterium violaceum]OQS27623.1 hypothetical protein B0T37_07020 [Chromobacterium violaceum]OQS47325.1 hypothetical protein B0T48_13790 [Chromobacterium violaceum]OQS50403.1 hypothetical protein B0T49_11990 [Chromobacterium violaceum]